MENNLIAIDGDGVIFNWNDAYARLWERCFGVPLSVHDEKAYFAMHRFNVPVLQGKDKAKFRAARDEQFWTTMDILPGAIQACHTLIEKGFELVMVTAADHKTREFRQRNLHDKGVPINKVYTVSDEPCIGSPKAKVLSELKPLAFVDDFLPYFKGVDKSIYKVLIDRNKECPHSPNKGDDLVNINSFKNTLLDFAMNDALVNNK